MNTGFRYKRKNNPLYPPFLRGNSVVASVCAIFSVAFARETYPSQPLMGEGWDEGELLTE